jgi:hypothetical protein
MFMLLEESRSRAIFGFSRNFLAIPSRGSDRAKKRQNKASHLKTKRKTLFLIEMGGMVKR